MDEQSSDEELISSEEKNFDEKNKNEEKNKNLPNLETKSKRKHIMTPERLEALARAREKALEVRRANTEARGKKVVREEAKHRAEKNKQDADAKFRDAVNARVEEELSKRMNQMNMDKINELLDEKLKVIKPKSKKKVVYEETETESEAETVKVVRKKKPKEPEPPPPPPMPQQQEIQQPQMNPNQLQLNQFTNMLRSIPRARANPFIN